MLVVLFAAPMDVEAPSPDEDTLPCVEAVSVISSLSDGGGKGDTDPDIVAPFADDGRLVCDAASGLADVGVESVARVVCVGMESARFLSRASEATSILVRGSGVWDEDDGKDMSIDARCVVLFSCARRSGEVLIDWAL